MLKAVRHRQFPENKDQRQPWNIQRLSEFGCRNEESKSGCLHGCGSDHGLSSFGDTQTFRRKLVAECPAILGTVPIYDAIVYYNKALKDITSREWIDIFKMHAEDGVDFMTIHCGINRSTADRFKAMKRQMNIVSRGGSLIFAWMEATGCENPFFEYYDEILDILMNMTLL